MTLPLVGFSLAASGSRMPLMVFSSFGDGESFPNIQSYVAFVRFAGASRGLFPLVGRQKTLNNATKHCVHGFRRAKHFGYIRIKCDGFSLGRHVSLKAIESES